MPGITVTPLTLHIGAEISEVSLANLSAADVAQIPEMESRVLS